LSTTIFVEEKIVSKSKRWRAFFPYLQKMEHFQRDFQSENSDKFQQNFSYNPQQGLLQEISFIVMQEKKKKQETKWGKYSENKLLHYFPHSAL
jgi:hypothetical protein